jgi:hypothetical protein
MPAMRDLLRPWRQAPAQMAHKAAPTYEGLRVAPRQSLVNGMDETGWRGRLAWMWNLRERAGDGLQGSARSRISRSSPAVTSKNSTAG